MNTKVKKTTTDRILSYCSIPNIRGFEGVREVRYFCDSNKEIVDIKVKTDDPAFNMEGFLSAATNKGIPDGYVGDIHVNFADKATISTRIDSLGRVVTF